MNNRNIWKTLTLKILITTSVTYSKGKLIFLGTNPVFFVFFSVLIGNVLVLLTSVRGGVHGIAESDVGVVMGVHVPLRGRRPRLLAVDAAARLRLLLAVGRRHAGPAPRLLRRDGGGVGGRRAAAAADAARGQAVGVRGRARA